MILIAVSQLALNILRVAGSKIKMDKYQKNLRKKPIDVPDNTPTSPIEMFNLQLWTKLKEMSPKSTIDIKDLQYILMQYNEIKRLLPIDKLINFNTLGCILGYNLSSYEINLNINKKKRSRRRSSKEILCEDAKKDDLIKTKKKKNKQKSNRYIKQQLDFLNNVSINNTNLDRCTLVRYIEYFKQRK